MSEHDEQSLFVSYVCAAYPSVLFHSIPNGANLAGNQRQRGMQMNYLKAEGLRPGCPDLFMAVARGNWHGCYIEMKTLDGELSDKQKAFIALAEAAGYFTIVAYGFEQAKELFDVYMEW